MDHSLPQELVKISAWTGRDTTTKTGRQHKGASKAQGASMGIVHTQVKVDRLETDELSLMADPHRASQTWEDM